MKNLIKILAAFLFVFSVSGCASNEQKINKTLEVKDMRTIAELATVECYFHNVAKSDQPTGKVWYEFLKKENIRFWVEYEGVVTVGVKADELNIEVNGENVKITLPKAVVLDAKIDDTTLTKDSFIYDKNSEKPTAEQETTAIECAQQEMISVAEANKTLLKSAEDNAKELLENYVKSISEVTGIQYSIEWVEAIKTTE